MNVFFQRMSITVITNHCSNRCTKIFLLTLITCHSINKTPPHFQKALKKHVYHVQKCHEKMFDYTSWCNLNEPAMSLVMYMNHLIIKYVVCQTNTDSDRFYVSGIFIFYCACALSTNHTSVPVECYTLILMPSIKEIILEVSRDLVSRDLFQRKVIWPKIDQNHL